MRNRQHGRVAPRQPDARSRGTAGLLRELAPYLAEEGIDLTDPGNPPDLAALQPALERAVARRNMALLTPVGRPRDLAVVTLGLVADAVAAGDVRLVSALLAQVEPESPDDSVATVSSCTGVALHLLDRWLSGGEPDAPAGLVGATRLSRGERPGRRAVPDVLALAAKGSALDSVGALIARRGGDEVLRASALALAAAAIAWARLVDTPVHRVVVERIA